MSRRVWMNRLVWIPGLLVLLIGLLAGCATTGRGPAFSAASVPAGKAIVYLYRPKSFMMSARTIFLALPTSEKSYAMVNGGYFPLIVDPGRIEVAAVGADAKATRLELDAQAGVEEYVRVTFNSLALVPNAELEVVPASQGKSEIQGCTLISE